MFSTILCVDDTSIHLNKVSDLLTKKGLNVISATNGIDGIKAAIEHIPQLIFLDIKLPDLDGFMVLKYFKKTQITSHIPVIALTAYTMSGDKENIIASGFDDYLAKPVVKNELYQVIERFLKSG